VGYNTVNVYAYYGLNSIFKTAEIDGGKINMKAFNSYFLCLINKYNNSICGMLPKKELYILEVCAFITKRKKQQSHS
jgi:hypothetical protein